jgi:polysaccharide export outer membrane protein
MSWLSAQKVAQAPKIIGFFPGFGEKVIVRPPRWPQTPVSMNMRCIPAYPRSLAIALAAGCLAMPNASFGQEAGERFSLKMTDELTLSAPKAIEPGVPVAAPGASTLRDYRIGADDLLEVQVFGVDQLSRTVRVNSRGQVSLPLVGTLQVGGLTGQEAEGMLAQKLAENYLQNPQVSLFIREYTSQRVTVEGAVNKPGVYPLRGPTTLLQTLALAGGQASLSDMNEVMLFRPSPDGKRSAQVYDVERIRAGEIDDPAVMSEDLVVVKRSPTRILFKDSVLRDILDALNPFR